MKRCVIIGSANVSISMREYIKEGDFIIAADAGYLNARKLCVSPDLYVGDYDTVSPPKNVENLIKLSCDKDDTDIMYAARAAVEYGYEHVTIIGGMGGRFDHTIANMQVLVYFLQNNVESMLCDENNEITVMSVGEKELLPREDWYVSFFPVGERTKGVTLKHLKYALDNATLTNSFPVAVSNEYRFVPAYVTITDGGLFIIHSRKD